MGVYGLARTYIDSAVGKRLDAETLDKIEIDIKRLSGLRTELAQNQNVQSEGYVWIGYIKFVWGTDKSTKQNQEFKFKDPFDNECFAVITELNGKTISKNHEGFTLRRHKDY